MPFFCYRRLQTTPVLLHGIVNAFALKLDVLKCTNTTSNSNLHPPPAIAHHWQTGAHQLHIWELQCHNTTRQLKTTEQKISPQSLWWDKEIWSLRKTNGEALLRFLFRAMKFSKVFSILTILTKHCTWMLSLLSLRRWRRRSPAKKSLHVSF